MNNSPDQPVSLNSTDVEGKDGASQEDCAARKVPESHKSSLQSGFLRRARNPLIKSLNFLISLFVFCLLFVIAIGYLGDKYFREEGPLTSLRSVIIRQGSSLSAIADQLKREKIIDNALIFNMGVRAHHAQSKMKAGEYAFSPLASMYEVMQTLLSGKGVVHKISIPEGLTSFKIIQRIAENDVLVGSIADAIPAEGSLMPDTYHFYRGLSRQKLIDRMMAAHENFLQKIWKSRDPDLPVSTPEEMVVLASIVEKETARAGERPHVASVFINRLVKGMRLQSDPTVIYGIFGGRGKPKGRPIYQSDLKNANDYNTYIIKTLPQGPISNPGKESLKAVANPLRTRDLFFVSDGAGGHIFSDSLSAHNINVARWRAIERKMKNEK